MEYKPIDARDMLPHGGRDNYTGDHADFNSLEQLRQSDTFDNFTVTPKMGSSDVMTCSREELHNKSHMYSMHKHDLGASAGISSVNTDSKSIYSRSL